MLAAPPDSITLDRVRAKMSRCLKTSLPRTHTEAQGGAYYPLSVYAAQGYNTEDIKANFSDTRGCPIVGTTYRAPVTEVKDSEAVQRLETKVLQVALKACKRARPQQAARRGAEGQRLVRGRATSAAQDHEGEEHARAKGCREGTEGAQQCEEAKRQKAKRRKIGTLATKANRMLPPLLASLERLGSARQPRKAVKKKDLAQELRTELILVLS